jgi:hypothetical protein
MKNVGHFFLYSRWENSKLWPNVEPKSPSSKPGNEKYKLPTPAELSMLLLSLHLVQYRAE